jgi:hypothetical protein
MLYTNNKTNVTFNAYTVKDRNGYAAVVTRREGNTETGIVRNVFASRSKAYYNARKEGLYAAMMHASVFGM